MYNHRSSIIPGALRATSPVGKRLLISCRYHVSQAMHRVETAEIIDQNVSIIRSLPINTRKCRLDDTIRTAYQLKNILERLTPQLSQFRESLLDLSSKIGMVYFFFFLYNYTMKGSENLMEKQCTIGI